MDFVSSSAPSSILRLCFHTSCLLLRENTAELGVCGRAVCTCCLPQNLLLLSFPKQAPECPTQSSTRYCTSHCGVRLLRVR